ncbi:protease pro-enzyme activation domain-containing protein [uncultured Jatrophihabitans sp.]|uniref:S53 family peptidase n=1 Tax=uncultured Jatrophihabitans sp. TaxID=1610747 RepID=UPI0035C9FB3D
MHKHKTIALATVGVTAAAVFTAGLATAATGSAATPATPIARSKPAWTAHAQHLGAAKSSSKVKGRVYLAPRGGLAAVASAANAISTPGSASYGRFLTPAQYKSRFGTTAATVAKVTKYLRLAGLTVSKPASDNSYVTISGSVRAAEKAFATDIARYRHAGLVVQAPSKSLKVPASLASAVLTVSGLDTTPQRTAPASKQDPPPEGFRNARPCSIDFGTVQAKYQADYKTPLPKFGGNYLSYSPCGYTGPQLRSAYEGDTALDGSGVTVAITDAYAAPTIVSDINTYAENHGDGSYARGQYTQVVPKTYTNQADCGPSGWYGEETLDIEAVHAMAPGAKIRYYASASCFDDDFIDTLAKVVLEDKASIVSNSWADVEEAETGDSVAAYEKVFLQGATEGISFTFSSGDDGDELAATGVKQVDYPASDPYVTGVGGTSTAISGGTLLGQAGWGTVKYTLSSDGKSWKALGFLYGAGGGTSALFNRPSYQKGVTQSPYRSVPDVSMDADPNTGFLIGETQTFSDGVYYDEYRIGGTSLASPLFAGETALSFQNADRGVGLLNPVIYAKKSSFTDVKGVPAVAGDVRADFANGENADDGVLYSVRTFGEDSSLKVVKGYDNVTGVGVPNTKWLTAIPKA